MATRFVMLFLLAWFSGGAQPREVKKIEFFVDNFYLHRPYKMSLNEISSDVHFFGEKDTGPLVQAVNSFTQVLSKQKSQKRKHFNGDNRILLVLIYDDDSTGFISANQSKYILYNEVAYKDEQHNLLILINAYFEVPSIKRFLEEEKIIPTSQSPPR